MKKEWFTYNIWLKVIALVLAVVTWFYVNAELVGGKGF